MEGHSFPYRCFSETYGLEMVFFSNERGTLRTNQSGSLYPQGLNEAVGHPVPILKANQG